MSGSTAPSPPLQTTIALIQMSASDARTENLANASQLARDAAAQGAQIICFQELFLDPYFCQTEDAAHFALAEPFPGPLCDTMSALAKELRTVLIVPFFEKRAPGLYHNAAFVVDADGSILGHYRKIHIPDDPGFSEKYYFTPGDLGFRSWDTAFGRIGVLICWDQWFPEAARLTAMQGADILFYPTAIGWLPSEKEAMGGRQFRSWQTIQRSHAIANGCYVAAVNRVGHEFSRDTNTPTKEGIQFWGQSFVADPSGDVIAEADATSETIVIAKIDRTQIESQRIEWPFFRDRRNDTYGEITQRFGK